MIGERRLGVSVLGAGRWGKNLVRVFGSMDTARLVSVCDRDGARLAHLRTDADCVQDDSVVLADPRVDAVVIATPPSTHADIAVAALEAGKHVFVEKPMALSTEDAQRVLSAAHLHRRRGMVGLVLRYHPAIEQLEHWIRRGVLGTVQRVVCTRHNVTHAPEEASPWWSLGPHDVSISRFLLGAEPHSVTLARDAGGEATRFLAELHFPGGSVAEISAAFGAREKARRLVVAGTRAIAVFDDVKADRKLLLFDAKQVPLDELARRDLSHSPSPKLAAELPLVEPLQAEATHFVAAILRGTPLRTDIVEGARVVAILEAGETSLASGTRRISLTRAGRHTRTQPHAEHAAATARDGSRIA